MEFIKHALGLCGEHSHPSLLTLILSGGLASTTLMYISGSIKDFFK
jgi:hypothetical protein